MKAECPRASAAVTLPREPDGKPTDGIVASFHVCRVADRVKRRFKPWPSFDFRNDQPEGFWGPCSCACATQSACLACHDLINRRGISDSYQASHRTHSHHLPTVSIHSIMHGDPFTLYFTNLSRRADNKTTASRKERRENSDPLRFTLRFLRCS